MAALVTGGAIRIGKSVCLRLSKLGYGVIIHYRSSSLDADALAQTIRATGGKAVAIQCDLQNANDVSLLVSRGTNEINLPLQVLVNSASIFEHDDIHSLSYDSFQRHMNVNLLAPTILCSKMFENILERKRSGKQSESRGLEHDSLPSIINILDQKLANSNGDHLSYTLSKYGLSGLTETLARSLAPHIRVNAIAPGFTLGNSTMHTDDGFSCAQKESPLGYGPDPDDIADAVAYLTQSKSITGQTIFVDAGERFNSRTRDIMFNMTTK